MKLREALQMLLLSAVWGASFLLIKLSGQDFPPAWVALLRLVFGAALLWIVLLAGRHRLPPRRYFGALLAVAILNNAIPFSFFAWGEQTVPSSTAAILNATTPIWALLLGLATGGAKASRITAAGVALGFFGVLCVVYGHASAGSTNPADALGYWRGVLLILAASLGYALATTLAKASLQGVDPVAIATSQLTLAALVVLPVAGFGPRPTAAHPASIAAVATLGVLGSGFAYLLYFRLLSTISPTHVVAVTYLLPVWGLFWGAMDHEPIRCTAYAGVTVVLAGLVLLNLRTGVRSPVARPIPATVSDSEDSAAWTTRRPTAREAENA